MQLEHSSIITEWGSNSFGSKRRLDEALRQVLQLEIIKLVVGLPSGSIK
jgi:hypothetical protein